MEVLRKLLRYGLLSVVLAVALPLTRVEAQYTTSYARYGNVDCAAAWCWDAGAGVWVLIDAWWDP